MIFKEVFLMANTAYVGAGTTLGTSYYMRRFYAANADARTTTSRSNLTNSTLTGADSPCDTFPWLIYI